MFCSKCGAQIAEHAKFCPSCGNPCTLAGDIKSQAQNVIGGAERQFDSAVNEMRNDFRGTTGERLQDDRGLLSLILLSFITCGIYNYYFIYKIARDVNIACEGDGESTTGLFMFIILSILTCGLYTLYWYFTLGNRLQQNAPRYGMTFSENGTTLVLFIVLGAAFCGLGPIFAMYVLIRNTNKICAAYNQAHGFR